MWNSYLMAGSIRWLRAAGLLVVSTGTVFADPPKAAGEMTEAPGISHAPTLPPGELTVLTWYRGARGAISLGFDDNRVDHWSIAAPEMTARGLRGTFHVIPGLPQWTLWRDHYAAMAEAGHELASHTMTHRYCVIRTQAEDPDDLYFHSPAELEADCQTAKSLLEAFTQRAAVTIAYPGGQVDSQTMPILMSYFLGGRTSTRGPLTNDLTPTNMGFLLATRVGAGANSPVWASYEFTRDHLTSFLELAEQSGKWVIYEHHDVAWPGYSGVNVQAWVEHLDELAEAQDARRVWVAPEGDVVRYIYERNAAQATVTPVSRGLDVSVDDGLEDTVFDVSLTVEITIAPQWIPTLAITHAGEPVEFAVERRGKAIIVRFDLDPDCSVTQLRY